MIESQELLGRLLDGEVGKVIKRKERKEERKEEKKKERKKERKKEIKRRKHRKSVIGKIKRERR